MTVASAPSGVAVTAAGTFSVSDACSAPKRLRIVASTASSFANHLSCASSVNQKRTTSLIQPGVVVIHRGYRKRPPDEMSGGLTRSLTELSSELVGRTELDGPAQRAAVARVVRDLFSRKRRIVVQHVRDVERH